ncbi:MAG: agmatinase [bacterium]|jgi:agmatinase
MSDIECPGAGNFLGLCASYSSPGKSRFAIIPVPYDATSTYISGSSRGPAAIIEASANIEIYDHELNLEPARQGVYTAPPVEPSPEGAEATLAAIQAAVEEAVMAGSVPVVLGGEHTVSLGAVRALARGEDLFVVSFDAHADLRDSYDGTPLSHACFLRRALEVAGGTAIGVRSLSRGERDFAEAEGVRIIYAEEISEMGAGSFDLDHIPRNVYISMDLDVLDPSLMPSTGTPEPGGLSWYDLIDFAKRVISGRRVLGFDVVELCPQPGNVAPDFAAAKLIYKLMGIIIECSANGGS